MKKYISCTLFIRFGYQKMTYVQKLLPSGRSFISKPGVNLTPTYMQRGFHVTSSATSKAATASSATKENARPISEMPGLTTLPFVGSTLSILMRKDFDNKKLHIFWSNVMKEYGPTIRITFPGTAPMVAISKPDDVEKVFRETMSNPIRDAFQSVKRSRDAALNGFLEKKAGIIAENNEEWWRVRKRIQSPMLGAKNLVRYISQMDEVALQFMDRIADLQKCYGEMPDDFLEHLYKWALESVSLVALDRRLGCLESNVSPNATPMQLIRIVNEMFGYLNDTELNVHWWKIFPTKAYRNLMKNQEQLISMVLPLVEELEADIKARDAEENRDPSLLETLLQKDGLTRKDVITVILDMLTAGIDTTSHTVGFALYALAKNKEAQTRLQKEVDSALGEGKGPITETQLTKLPFLKACVKESLRVYPLVGGLSRMLLEDTVIDGYLVPKGNNALVINPVITKDEKLFPHANEFRPERWGKDHPLGPIHPFASLPFSHGPRMCVGRRIAEQEIYIFLARTFQRYNVDYKYKDMDMVTKLVTVPSEPLRFEFSERR